MARSPQAAFESHERALGSGDLEQLAADFSNNCILIVNGQVRRGKSGVKEGFAHIFSELGKVNGMDAPVRVFEDNVLYVEWRADLGDRRCDGVDTLIFEDGLIAVQTAKYEIKALATLPA